MTKAETKRIVALHGENFQETDVPALTRRKEEEKKAKALDSLENEYRQEN